LPVNQRLRASFNKGSQLSFAFFVRFFLLRWSRRSDLKQHVVKNPLKKLQSKPKYLVKDLIFKSFTCCELLEQLSRHKQAHGCLQQEMSRHKVQALKPKITKKSFFVSMMTFQHYIKSKNKYLCSLIVKLIQDEI
jgi:hypothetical protein